MLLSRFLLALRLELLGDSVRRAGNRVSDVGHLFQNNGAHVVGVSSGGDSSLPAETDTSWEAGALDEEQTVRASLSYLAVLLAHLRASSWSSVLVAW